MGGNFELTLNYDLASIDGVGSLASIGGSLEVTGNKKLPTCAAERLRDQFGVANIHGSVNIADTDSGGSCQ